MVQIYFCSFNNKVKNIYIYKIYDENTYRDQLLYQLIADLIQKQFTSNNYRY